MFDSFLFDVIEFDGSLSYYFETPSGGVLVGGTAPPSFPAPCPCNTYVLPVSVGGVSVGGSAVVADTIIRGGVLVGGSASFQLVNDPFDGFAAVWLLGESANGTTGEYADQTRFHLDGTGGGGVAQWTPTQDPGVFCRDSQLFDGRDFISFPSDRLATSQAFTTTLWARISTFFKLGTWFSRGFDSSAGDRWAFQFGHSQLNQLTARLQLLDDQGEPVTRYVLSPTQLEIGRWYHVACVWDPGAGLSVYCNGSLHATKSLTETTTVTVTNGSYVGRWNTGQTPTGNIQDVRVHPVARDADWIAAEYANVCNPDFYSVGAEVLL